MASKAFDVSEPGKSPADPTSRPIIVGHGTMLSHDPMVSDTSKTEANSVPNTIDKTELKTPSSRNKVLTPSSTESEDSASPPEPVKQVAGTSDSSDSAIVDAVADEAASKNKQKSSNDEEPNEEDQAQRKHIANLIADKTYFLPIGQVTRKKQARKSLIIGLILIIVLGGGGYVVYARGLLK